jgi:hypothetical protein
MGTDRVFAAYGSPNATELVKPVLKTLSTGGPKANLEKFTSFRTRCTYNMSILVDVLTHETQIIAVR